MIRAMQAEQVVLKEKNREDTLDGELNEDFSEEVMFKLV